MTNDNTPSPLGIKILSISLFLFSFFAFFGSLFMWGEGFLFSFPAGADFAYPITDILVNAPASLIAAVGLWKMKRFGYVASQFVAGFYIYASVEIFIHVIQEGSPYALAIVLPQVLAVIIGIALVIYLWQFQDTFFCKTKSNERKHSDG